MNQITVNSSRCVEHIADAGKKLGAIIFFNGMGEAKSAKDNWDALYVHGPAKRLKAGWKPNYVNVYCVQTPVPFPSADWVTGVLDDISSKANVDAERLYAAGLSAGAITWNKMVGYHAEIASRIAAIGCLSGNWEPAITNAKNIPIRAIHGTSDTTVRPGSITTKIKAMQDAGYKNKELYLLPGGHTGAFWGTYFNEYVGLNGKNIYRWLVQWKRGGIKA